jgi:hypothetical protein
MYANTEEMLALQANVEHLMTQIAELRRELRKTEERRSRDSQDVWTAIGEHSRILQQVSSSSHGDLKKLDKKGGNNGMVERKKLNDADSKRKSN